MNSSVPAKQRTNEDLVPENCFDALYAEHGGWLMLILNNWGIPHHLAEDISQAVWIKVHRALASFDGQSPRAWLASIARNEIATTFRPKKEQLLRKAVSTTTPEGCIEIPCEMAPDDYLQSQEMRAQLIDCLGNLVEEHQSVVQGVLRGDDYDEIASHLQLSKPRLYKLFYEAKAKLKTCMEVHGW